MRRGEKRPLSRRRGSWNLHVRGSRLRVHRQSQFELRNRGVRDRADITWITNDYELGDFGMGGMHLKRSGYVTPSSILDAGLFAERGIN